MNRSLKFRVWDIRQQRYLLPNETGAYLYLFPTREESIEQEKGRGVGILHLGHAISQTDRYVVEQFTGLTDREDRRIYEGDILSVHYPQRRAYENGKVFWSLEYLTYLVKHYYNGDYASQYLCHLHNEGTEIRVVGNIHENPTLLPA